MTMTMIQNKLLLSSDLAERAKERAWRDRTTVGAMIREVLLDYSEHGGEANLAPIDVPSQQVRLSHRVDADLWDAVKKRAGTESVSVAGVIRRGLVARTEGVRV
jgi:hypothetical protein